MISLELRRASLCCYISIDRLYRVLIRPFLRLAVHYHAHVCTCLMVVPVGLQM